LGIVGSHVDIVVTENVADYIERGPVVQPHQALRFASI
jgi:hypothetical protein